MQSYLNGMFYFKIINPFYSVKTLGQINGRMQQSGQRLKKQLDFLEASSSVNVETQPFFCTPIPPLLRSVILYVIGPQIFLEDLWDQFCLFICPGWNPKGPLISPSFVRHTISSKLSNSLKNLHVGMDIRTISIGTDFWKSG